MAFWKFPLFHIFRVIIFYASKSFWALTHCGDWNVLNWTGYNFFIAKLFWPSFTIDKLICATESITKPYENAFCTEGRFSSPNLWFESGIQYLRCAKRLTAGSNSKCLNVYTKIVFIDNRNFGFKILFSPEEFVPKQYI